VAFFTLFEARLSIADQAMWRSIAPDLSQNVFLHTYSYNIGKIEAELSASDFLEDFRVSDLKIQFIKNLNNPAQNFG
jgi:hypothetical protein